MFTTVFCIQSPKVLYRGIVKVVKLSWRGEMFSLASEGQWLMSQLPELHCMALQMCLPIFSLYLYLTEKALLVGGKLKQAGIASQCSLYESMEWKSSSQLHRNSYNRYSQTTSLVKNCNRLCKTFKVYGNTLISKIWWKQKEDYDISQCLFNYLDYKSRIRLNISPPVCWLYLHYML